MKKFLIKNGTIIDGTGHSAYSANIEIENNIISKIGDIKKEPYHKIINASGLVVCPGFIDTYSHSDIEILKNRYVESKLRQGVTTEILGQSGLSVAPLVQKYIKPLKKNIAESKGELDCVDWNWKDTDGYLKIIEEIGPLGNYAYLVPHGNIRMEAIGLSRKNASRTDIDNMKNILSRELKAGAIGMSTNLLTPPCSHSDVKELVELCEILVEHNKIFVVQQKNEADHIINSIEEILNISKTTNVRTHFSRFRVCGKHNKDKISYIMSMLNIINYEGYDITFDQSPYESEVANLSIILPNWVQEGGTEKLIERLKTGEVRKRIIYDIENGIQNWDNFLKFTGFENIYISSLKQEHNQKLIGKNLLEICELLKKDKYNALFDLLIEEENNIDIYYYLGDEDDIIRFLKRSEENICSGALSGNQKHPRKYDSFPKVIRRFVNELNEISLEEAIYKMTGRAAKTFNLKNRGLIREGYSADLVIFDPDLITNHSDFIKPEVFPTGINYIFVNGRIVFIEDEVIEVSCGEVIRAV